MRRYRGVRTCKAYICLFVCLSTKALHLELATDLTSSNFLAVLAAYSDCGTNFVGEYKEINRIISTAAAREALNWHFNPPLAPHFGGFWEAGIKSVKTHLLRLIGHQRFTFEEFYTILTLIESTLNSRPLTPMSSDVDDINALTPGLFLTTTALPVPEITFVPFSRLSRWKLVQRLHQDFWRRYKIEYLHTLQQRSKWLKCNSNPKIGTLVLIKNENTSPLQWS